MFQCLMLPMLLPIQLQAVESIIKTYGPKRPQMSILQKALMLSEETDVEKFIDASGFVLLTD